MPGTLFGTLLAGARERRLLAGFLSGLGVLAALVVVLRPIGGGLSGHDLVWHVTRLAQWHQGVVDGVLYPRFFHDVFYGYGGPVMMYIPPVPYMVAEIGALFGAGPITSLGLVIRISFILGTVGVFFLARPTLGPSASALAAAAYTLAPYRMLDAYVRGAYSELMATALLPMLLVGVRLAVMHRHGAATSAVAVGSALLVLTHASSAVFCLPLAVVYGLWCLGDLRRELRWAAVIRLAVGFSLGVGLSAFYAVPAILEQKFSKLTVAFAETYRPEEGLLWLHQLFKPEWGFGWSVAGPADGMSFQIGLVHIAAVVAALWLAACGPQPVRRELRFWLAALCVAGVLTLQASAWLWRSVSVLAVIQWPWRLLVVVSLASSVAVGAVLRIVPDRAVAVRSVLGLAIVVVMLAAYGPFATMTDPRLMDAEDTAGKPSDPRFLRAEWFLVPLGAVIDPEPGPRALIERGDGRLMIVDDRTHRLSAQIEASTDLVVRLRIYDFPGWRAEIDGERSPVSADGIGAIRVTVPAGNHRLDLRFGSTPVRRWAAAMSVASLLLLVGVALLWSKKVSKIAGHPDS